MEECPFSRFVYSLLNTIITVLEQMTPVQFAEYCIVTIVKDSAYHLFYLFIDVTACIFFFPF